MPDAEPTTLDAFAYGEATEGPGGRSLGFQLLAPPGGAPWAAEVEALARRFQAAPYPDHWPEADLFCSVLLADGRRLVAVARYGLLDKTAGHRRGGLELVGVVGPNALSAPQALGVYRWLRRRAATDDLASLGESVALDVVLAEAPPPSPAAESSTALPIRLWQDGALLFSAATPTDPDLRLGLLDQATSPNWQWLPLTGPDFPIALYARRGPLIAWTVQVAGVAWRYDQPHAPIAPASPSSSRAGWILAAALGALLIGNLVALRLLDRRLERVEGLAATPGTVVPAAPAEPEARPSGPRDEKRDEELAIALYRYLKKRGCMPEGSLPHFAQQYELLAAQDDALRVSSPEARAALGAVAQLTKRTPAQIRATIQDVAGASRGLDPDVVKLIAQRVYDRLSDE